MFQIQQEYLINMVIMRSDEGQKEYFFIYLKLRSDTLWLYKNNDANLNSYTLYYMKKHNFDAR